MLKNCNINKALFRRKWHVQGSKSEKMSTYNTRDQKIRIIDFSFSRTVQSLCCFAVVTGLSHLSNQSSFKGTTTLLLLLCELALYQKNSKIKTQMKTGQTRRRPLAHSDSPPRLYTRAPVSPVTSHLTSRLFSVKCMYSYYYILISEKIKKMTSLILPFHNFILYWSIE